MNDAVAWLQKKAEGFSYEEVIEEYAEAEGEMRLVRRKVSTKYSPPDVTAIKALREKQTDLASMSNEDLSALRKRLERERDKERRLAKSKHKE